MKNILAKVISYLLVPPVNLLLTFIILSNEIYLDAELKQISILIAVIFGVILPILVFVYLRKKGKIVNDDATIKGERTLPYLIGIGFAINAIILSFIFKLHPLIISLWATFIIIQIIMVIINLYWKISAHLIGIGIAFGTFIFLFQSEAVYFVVLVIIVGWARLQLKVHTLMQVIAGFLLGFVPTYLILNESISNWPF